MRSRALRLAALPALAAAAILAGSGVSAAQHALSAPSAAQINARLRHTIEIGTTGEYFRNLGNKPLTIKDGRGTGTLTAVVGTRWPTADALGQVVFFWHNTTFIGQSADYETTAVRSLRSPAAGTFNITYAHYKASDPTCCPTLKPVKVTYGWSGKILISNGVPPKQGKAVRVKYQP
jgi:hypothetical protein